MWRTVKLFLRTYKESKNCREAVLPEILRAVRSLLCTTNATPHKRFLGFNQRSMSGRALPSFLIQPGPILMRRFIRSKSDPLVEEVELLDANRSFSHVCFANGRESTVSTGDLATRSVDDFEVTNVRQTSLLSIEDYPILVPTIVKVSLIMILIPRLLFVNLLLLQLSRLLLDVRLEPVKLHRDMGIVYTTRK